MSIQTPKLITIQIVTNNKLVFMRKSTCDAQALTVLKSSIIKLQSLNKTTCVTLGTTNSLSTNQ